MVQRVRLAELFAHFGRSRLDVLWQLKQSLPVKDELNYLRDASVYLGRYAHVSDAEFAAIELPELEQRVRFVRKWLWAESGRDEHGNKVKRDETSDDYYR